MPQTHCFPKHRDLNPAVFMLEQKIWVRSKVLKTLLKKFKDSSASSQVWSDLFAFPLGTHRQVRNWPATTVRATHSPVGLFSLGIYKVGEESQGKPVPHKGSVQQPSQVLFWVKGPPISPHVGSVLISPQWDQHQSEDERQWEAIREAKHQHFCPLVMVGGLAPGSEASSIWVCAHGLVVLVQVLGDVKFCQESFKRFCCL